MRCSVRNDDCGTAPGNARGLRAALRISPAGFTYVALLATIVIISISLGAAGKYWSSVMKREKEEELLFRGDQYRSAIERYYTAKQPFTFPNSIDDLLSDDRFPQAKRHLRKKFLDPVTNEDFELIRDLTKGNRITGVYSRSSQEPVRVAGFPDQYKEFEGKLMYSEWKFLYTPPQQQVPGHPQGTTPRGSVPVPVPPPPSETSPGPDPGP